MTVAQADQIVAELALARAERRQQHAEIVALLTAIRDGLTGPAEPPGCQHPEEARRDLSSMGEIEWICRACGFRYGPVKKEKADASVSQQPV